MHSMENFRIFLIGFMGAGKTTLGRGLAEALHCSFIDLDLYIEQRYHRTIGELFAEKGEPGFREIERRMLQEVSDFEHVVIATGGGTPCFFDNMERMNACGLTVYLEADPDILFRRLRIASQKRPLLRGKSDEELRSYIAEALEKRAPRYRQARLHFDASRLENRTDIRTALQALQRLVNDRQALR